MSIVYCRSCKSKITQRDTTCPKCGSPTSRIVPILFGIMLSTAAALVYNAYQQMVDNNNATMAAVKEAKSEAKNTPTLHTELDD